MKSNRKGWAKETEVEIAPWKARGKQLTCLGKAPAKVELGGMHVETPNPPPPQLATTDGTVLRRVLKVEENRDGGSHNGGGHRRRISKRGVAFTRAFLRVSPT